LHAITFGGAVTAFGGALPLLAHAYIRPWFVFQ